MKKSSTMKYAMRGESPACRMSFRFFRMAVVYYIRPCRRAQMQPLGANREAPKKQEAARTARGSSGRPRLRGCRRESQPQGEGSVRYSG